MHEKALFALEASFAGSKQRAAFMMAIALEWAHKHTCPKRTTERAVAARFTTVPNPWLRADKSAALSALFAGQPWKPGIQRGYPPIAWLQVR